MRHKDSLTPAEKKLVKTKICLGFKLVIFFQIPAQQLCLDQPHNYYIRRQDDVKTAPRVAGGAHGVQGGHDVSSKCVSVWVLLVPPAADSVASVSLILSLFSSTEGKRRVITDNPLKKLCFGSVQTRSTVVE